MNEIIGTAECLNDLCRKPVPVKKQRNDLTVQSCAWCGLMVQAHGAKGDAWLRSRMTPEGGTTPPAAAAPAPQAAAPAAVQAKAQAAEQAAEEPTIFDVFKKRKGARK